jgi:hypothetical protein
VSQLPVSASPVDPAVAVRVKVAGELPALGRPRQTLDKLVKRVVRERDKGSTWQAIADKLNKDGVPTQRGGAMWRVSSVQRLYQGYVLDEKARASR